MCFIIHFYIIFGTNLLTGGPAQNFCFFCLFQSFAEKEYQTESKRNETFGNVIFLGPEDTQEIQSSSQKSHEAATRVEGAPRGVARGPLPYGPLGDPLTQIFLLYIHIYSQTTRSIQENTFPPPQPSFPVRSHLGTFSGILLEGDSITEGFYINPIALPIKHEQLDGFLSLFDSQYHVLLDVLGDLSDVIFFYGVFVEI